MAADLAICPICGHESEPVIVDIAPRDDSSPPAPALAAPRPTFGRFIRGVIRRLPWGVIGVVIVIGGLVLGARAVLELDPSAIGVAPTITPTRTATSTRAPPSPPSSSVAPPAYTPSPSGAGEWSCWAGKTLARQPPVQPCAANSRSKWAARAGPAVAVPCGISPPSDAVW